MTVGETFKDNQRNGQYNIWRIVRIAGNRIHCILIADDMGTKTQETAAEANFTRSTVESMEKC